MPCIKSTSKYDSVNVTNSGNQDLAYYEMYPEDRWCVECGCVEPELTSTDWVCSCCMHNYRVQQFGVPDFENEYWMNSICDVGEKLRDSYSLMYVLDPEEPWEIGPYPINTRSIKAEKPEPLKFETIIAEKKQEIITVPLEQPKPNQEFKWAEPKPLKELPQPEKSKSDPPPPSGGKYVPPARRGRRG